MKHGNQYRGSIALDSYFNTNMANKRYIQFKHENDTWLRTLDYFQQENIYLKNRIAQIAKTNINNSFLNELEAYQTRFVDKDTIISILRYDISMQNDVIETNANKEDDDTLTTKIVASQNKLRADMQRMEKEFNRLKFDFNNYLSATLQ